ncbi:MAG: FG-GAP-like repeat-containing protein, partial [Planctomycetota bacterium]
MMHHRLLLQCCSAVLLLLVLGCSGSDRADSDVDDRVSQSDVVSSESSPFDHAKKLVAANRLDEATSMVSEALENDEPSSPGQASRSHWLLLASEIELKRQRPRLSMEYLTQIELANFEHADQTAKYRIELAERLGRFELVDSTFTEIIRYRPAEVFWQHERWEFLTRRGRLREASEQVDSLCKLGKATIPELLSVITRSEPSSARTVAEPSPIASARLAITRKQYSEAEAMLLDAKGLPASEENLKVALLMRVYAELQQWDAFVNTVGDAEKQQLQKHAEAWLALGTYWIDQSNAREATGALLRAIEIDPTLRLAYQRLSKALNTIGLTDDAAQFRYRGVQIAETETMAKRVLENGDNLAVRSDLARALLELGRPLEALEWTRSVIPKGASQAIAQIKLQRVGIVNEAEVDRMASVTAMLGLKTEDFPVEPSFAEILSRGVAGRDSVALSNESQSLSPPSLVNVAAKVGANFRWFVDDDETFEAIALYESLGGGIAVLDFNLDGWPDLYFQQGAGKPPSVNPNRSSELRRNLDGRFLGITEKAGCEDWAYSTGVAAGDVNQDGFADLYLGAIGQNRLLINNGDGTFRDATDSIESRDDYFTSSVSIADINGDSLPDLFEVNYIEMDGAFERPTKDTQGRYELPSPLLFYPQADRCFLSTPIGDFREITVDTESADPATGLGIVIADLDGQTGNEIFVGNDLRENHFLRYSDGAFVDAARAIGVASGRHGLANGCMGIATGDFDRNGQLDLHVGNYRGESDNLFLRGDNGFYRDLSTAWKLPELTDPLVAFGSKALDFDR